MIPVDLITLSHRQLLYLLRETLIASSVLGSIYLLVTCMLVLSFGRRDKIARASAVAVTVLKPLHGYEPRLFGRLSALCMQNYGGAVQLIFGTSQSSDPGLETLNRLQAAFPEKAITCQVSAQEQGVNRKVSNLVNMMQLAEYDVLVMADSDIEVGRDYLAEVVGELQRRDVGAVTCLYHGVAGAGIWSQLSALAINSQVLPQVVMALSLGLATPCFGATIAIRRRMLSSIGGLSAFADCLAEDYAIGEAVRASGYEVAIAPRSVGHVCFESDFKCLLARQMRFARTIRNIDPLGYAGSILTHPFAFALPGVLLADPSFLFVATVAVACRIMACMAVERTFGLRSQPYWLIPVQDTVAFLIHVAGFFGAAVDWRGHRYRLLPDGRLVSIEK